MLDSDVGQKVPLQQAGDPGFLGFLMHLVLHVLAKPIFRLVVCSLCTGAQHSPESPPRAKAKRLADTKDMRKEPVWQPCSGSRWVERRQRLRRLLLHVSLLRLQLGQFVLGARD